ncbi:MAG: hypothetical protein M1469_11870 [Bacteroidetes bacterium]|nr:hypothetical protein [Bacteroidota bacterium]
MYSKTVKELFILMFLAVTFSACQKSTPVAVPALQEFRDSSNLFTIKVPVGWPQSALPGKVWVYNSNDAANRFFDPTSSSKAGVKIYAFTDSAGAKTLDYVVQQFKDSLRTEQAQIDPDVQTTLAGNPAVKIPYALKIDSKNTVYSYRVLTVVDSTVYGYEVAGFNQEFKRYSDVFDTVQSTFRIIPKAVARQQLPENLIPSQTTLIYQNEYYSIQYPDNFKATPTGASGDIKTSVSIQGYFQDCTIQIDVLDAKKLTVEKVFQQNKGNYPNSKSEKIQLDGLDAYMISYSPVRGIQRRVYFVVKNNNWIRVILTWNEASQKKYSANFQQAFENAVSSLKLK